MKAHAVLLLTALALSFPASAQVPSFPSDEELKDKLAGALVTRLGKYGETDADWGFLLVPERRTVDTGGSRLLRLVVVRQRAAQAAARTPIFNLVGGPGKSNVWGSGEFGPRLHESRDVVRVGYRGIDSDVELVCPEFTQALQLDRPLSTASIERTRGALRACNDRLRGAGIDVDGYNLAEVVEDIEGARKALGYERVDFVAVSWGTQIALAYSLRHPERVERMLLIGAGGRSRGFDLWDPGIVDRKLRAYARLWKQAGRTAGLVRTIRRVLATSPSEWQGQPIDPDKVRLAAWHMLEETATAAQLFDTLAAAEKGDYGGVALLSWAYDDELRKELVRQHGPYHGEFFSKVMSSGLDPRRDWIREMDPRGSILGSPAGKLLWGAGSHGGWPIEVVPEDLRRDQDIDTETLVLMGNLDVIAPVEYVRKELLPRLSRGRFVIVSDAGHTDFIRLQPGAFELLMSRFFEEGVVDTSGFEHQEIDFTPGETLQDLSRVVLGGGGR